MSVKELAQGFKEHTYWHKDGDATPWLGAGTTYDGVITTASADNTDFGENLNDDALIEAIVATKKVIIKPPNGVVALAIRFRANGTEEDSNIVQLLQAAGVDYYSKIAQLTTTVGGQLDSNDYLFIDTIVEANNDWITDTSVIQPASVDDDIAMYVLNTHGCDRFAFFATTKNSTALYIDWREL